ncbi:hypothetical protein ACUSIJ_16035 [Pseudochelatococcus sp. B33]
MSGIDNREDEVEIAAERGSLWRITLPPLVWAGHFLLCYVAAAIWCAKVGDAGGLTFLRLGIGAATLAALGLIVGLGLRSARQWGPDDSVSGNVHRPESRHRFLGHAALLLSIISFVAVVYVAMPAVFIESCR